MKYTYKNECFISEKADIGRLTFLGIWIFATLVILLTDSLRNAFGGFFTVAAVLFTIWIFLGIHKRQKRALKIRRTALKEGVRYAGRIVDAGTKQEMEEYETRDENDRTEVRTCKVTNHWIDVEYIDSQTGKTEKVYEKRMVRNMEHLIGSSVDVYIWNQYSRLIHADIKMVYIDTNGLG